MAWDFFKHLPKLITCLHKYALGIGIKDSFVSGIKCDALRGKHH